MTVQSTHRSTREWVLLVVALVIVAGIVAPLWKLSGTGESQQEFLAKWTPERLSRLLLGPEQVACYFCFAWSGLILLTRWREVRRQRAAFSLDLLPTDEGARILPEDARPLARKVDQVTGRSGPYILGNMIRLGLGKYAISKSAPDVAEVVRNQADVEQSRFVATMGTVNYLAWAIPAIGFLGTVRGLAGGMSMAGSQETEMAKFIKQATDQLGIAFDCTFVALALSLVLMYFLHAVQRSEETLIIDCQDYCQEHLLLRLYDPHPQN
ncbi:MotA/TolQ/ExbB proton channel family protein [Fimbriiglobus ruber]|uniref:Putative biopolymer transport protein, ExbB family n=1 Tax=Fimbriiglobus ruber TaxID=1908690 RepID=A0A225D870_9BACT|nr:MotA/TolQ/ExbB proton channel family protein [Fimbriiglobus ruber]OWK35824.1 putative biopolymer transport protein, ExbB family [Fimbriiglobus ruber]